MEIWIKLFPVISPKLRIRTHFKLTLRVTTYFGLLLQIVASFKLALRVRIRPAMNYNILEGGYYESRSN